MRASTRGIHVACSTQPPMTLLRKTWDVNNYIKSLPSTGGGRVEDLRLHVLAKKSLPPATMKLPVNIWTWKVGSVHERSVCQTGLAPGGAGRAQPPREAINMLVRSNFDFKGGREGRYCSDWNARKYPDHQQSSSRMLNLDVSIAGATKAPIPARATSSPSVNLFRVVRVLRVARELESSGGSEKDLTVGLVGYIQKSGAIRENKDQTGIIGI